MLYKNIDYSLYYNIIKRFFEILIRDVAERDRVVYLPNSMGYVYLDENLTKEHFILEWIMMQLKNKDKQCIVKYLY